jgi:hypothetical protein
MSAIESSLYSLAGLFGAAFVYLFTATCLAHAHLI